MQTPTEALQQSDQEEKHEMSGMVQFLNRPIRGKGDEQDIEYLSPEEAAKRFGMKKWTESEVLVDEGIAEDIADNGAESIDDPQFQKIKEQLKRASDNIVICQLDDSGEKGIFSKDKWIRKGEVIAIYTGRYTNLIQSKEAEGNYHFSIPTKTGENVTVNAEEYGNAARFAGHLLKAAPTPEDIDKGDEHLKKTMTLQDYTFTPKEKKEQIATANVRIKDVCRSDGKVPFLILEASEDIPPYSQIGYDYGLRYWVSKKKAPNLYTKNGNVVPHSDYTVEKPVTYYLESGDRSAVFCVGKSSLEETANISPEIHSGLFRKTGGKLVPRPEIKEAFDVATKDKSPFVLIDLNKAVKEEKLSQKHSNKPAHSKWIDVLKDLLVAGKKKKKKKKGGSTSAILEGPNDAKIDPVRMVLRGPEIGQDDNSVGEKPQGEAHSSTLQANEESTAGTPEKASLKDAENRDSASSLSTEKFEENKRQEGGIDQTPQKEPNSSNLGNEGKDPSKAASDLMEPQEGTPTHEGASAALQQNVLLDNASENMQSSEQNEEETENSTLSSAPNSISKEVKEEEIGKRRKIHLPEGFQAKLSELITRKRDNFVFNVKREEGELVIGLINSKRVMLKESEIRDQLIDLWRLFENENTENIVGRTPNFDNSTLTIKANPKILNEIMEVFHEEAEKYISPGPALQTLGIFNSPTSLNKQNSPSRDDFECRMQ